MNSLPFSIKTIKEKENDNTQTKRKRQRKYMQKRKINENENRIQNEINTAVDSNGLSHIDLGHMRHLDGAKCKQTFYLCFFACLLIKQIIFIISVLMQEILQFCR